MPALRLKMKRELRGVLRCRTAGSVLRRFSDIRRPDAKGYCGPSATHRSMRVKVKSRKARVKKATVRACEAAARRIRSRELLEARAELLRCLLRDARLEKCVQWLT